MNIYFSVYNTIRFLFWAYGILIFIRVISSWFPHMARYKMVRLVFKLVDPYLNFFKRFIPPIGGVMDISPIVAFFILQFLEKILIWIIF